MKQMLSIFCAIVLLIAPTNVYASEIYGDGSATTTVTAHVDSQYCVLIPETIVADGTPYYFTASLMDLAQGDTVNISCSGFDGSRLPMSGGNEGAYALFESDDTAISNDIIFATFEDGQTTVTNGLRATLQEANKAGDYTGTITFNISLSHNG